MDPVFTTPGLVLHKNLEDAAAQVHSYVGTDNSERNQRVAAYAFEYQVPILHAAWAINVQDGHATACSCAACERSGLDARVRVAEMTAWAAKAQELDAAHHLASAWIEPVTAAASAAGQREAQAVLEELEAIMAARPPEVPAPSL